jgi:hypothetical protein
MSGLIVPVDVLAYCVGTVDAHGPVHSFAGATTDYSSQDTPRPAFLGINVTRDADTAPMWPLESGIHLHWAVPDALTRAAVTAGPMSFPALPNRWLVTRISGNAQGAKHWIVSSDALSSSPPDGHQAPTVPVAQQAAHPGGPPQRAFRYLGTAAEFTPDWAEPKAGPETLKAMTGAELHAVATGDITFAAFYPSSRSSFGFHDDLADLAGAPAELTYVVTGWYGTPASDPLQAGLTADQLQAQLGWTTGSPSATVSYSVYSGLVQGIRWDPNTRYLTDDPEPVAADVAVGNHPAEALAAYLRGTGHPALTAFEELLTLYLTGLLPNLATPEAGQLARLEEVLHELQFSSTDGGTIYTITRGSARDTQEVTDLPLRLADALNLLNTRQQAADLAAVQARQGKWQLFTSWCRLFEVSQDDQNAAFGAFSRQYGLLPAILAQAQTTALDAATQRTAVHQMMGTGLTLTPVPAARYCAPTDPVVLLAGDAAAPAVRYGGDGRYHPAGYLACRLDSDVLQRLGIGRTATLQAAQFTALTPASLDQLPHPEIAALIQEAALLDTAIGAAASGVAEPALAADLVTWLEGGTPRYYRHPTGVPPSAVAVGVWPGANPWMSLFVLWDAQFHPLLDPVADDGSVADYPPGFFTANYQLDPDQPRMISYAPAGGGISIDPALIDFTSGDQQSGTHRCSGQSVLSTTSADNLRAQLARDPAAQHDPTLQAIAEQLAGTGIAMQSLAGFTDALLTRQPSIQLAIGVSPSAPQVMRSATSQVTSQITALTEIPPLAPLFNGSYNGVRAGYLKLSLRVMDPFGRKRPVQVGNLYIADSLAAQAGDGTIPGVVYVQPRLAQGSRLLFRWLAADSTEYDEMNAHPATTPVCGWLLPDHLSTGFFLYNAQGDPLGSLTLRADESGIIWQAAPGNQATIDADLVTVMADQNPHLRELALALGGGTVTPASFRAFWQAADQAVTQIVPTAPTSQTSLAALVGRPLALVQASLRLERQGLAALDQAFATLADGDFADTDHAVGGVQFPVVIGDLKRLDDGLVGYFRQATAGGYDTATFFSEAATGSDPSVAIPPVTNVLLSAAATPQAAPGTPPAATKLLMLVDPRTPVHATMGILPAQTLTIPPEQYEDIMAGLELTFPVHPALRAPGGLAVPLPAITGYEWSWITEESAGGSSSWAVDPELRPVTTAALWQYSPQALTEGWLRLNPQLLRFALTGADGTPVVTAGTTASLELLVKNTRRVPVTFGTGSSFYVHLGSLVDAGQVGAIQFAAVGWRFELVTDAQYGSYWAAVPDPAPVTLAPGEQVVMTVANVAIAAGLQAQARVSFDYHNLTGIDDGIDIAVLTVQQPSPAGGLNS